MFSRYIQQTSYTPRANYKFIKMYKFIKTARMRSLCFFFSLLFPFFFVLEVEGYSQLFREPFDLASVFGRANFSE